LERKAASYPDQGEEGNQQEKQQGAQLSKLWVPTEVSVMGPTATYGEPLGDDNKEDDSWRVMIDEEHEHNPI